MSELAWLNAVDVARRVNLGELDPQAITTEHLERIANFNLALNAYIQIDEHARAAAQGPLAGCTIAVKESYQVQGMSWTWSSPKFDGQVAGTDSEPVVRAREAGAAVIGKTNIPELVASVGTMSPLFGPTQNPWQTGITPGGSSGGSAAAVAAGLATVALGDDLGGSIRVPASCCGIVGLRPTAGRVREDIPDPMGINSRGPMTRTVADARLLFEVLTGETAPPRSDRRRRLLHVLSTPIGMAEPVAAAATRAVEALARAGHETGTAMAWDPMPVAAAYKVNRRVSLAAWPGEPSEYSVGVRTLISEGREIGAAEFFNALQAGLDAGRRIRDALETDGFDAIVSPTIGLVPMAYDNLPPFLGDAWNQHVQFVLPVSYSRLPSISIPAGLFEGLPIGVMLTGNHGREWELLDLAEDLEAQPGFGFQRPPDFE
jgi:Asp-tRNA(Asn)/Glu-tRNA(Gln) amidotransferase A subunit family amidase